MRWPSDLDKEAAYLSVVTTYLATLVVIHRGWQ